MSLWRPGGVRSTGGRQGEASGSRDGGPGSRSGAPDVPGPLSSPGIRTVSHPRLPAFRWCPGPDPSGDRASAQIPPSVPVAHTPTNRWREVEPRAADPSPATARRAGPGRGGKAGSHDASRVNGRAAAALPASRVEPIQSPRSARRSPVPGVTSDGNQERATRGNQLDGHDDAPDPGGSRPSEGRGPGGPEGIRIWTETS